MGKAVNWFTMLSKPSEICGDRENGKYETLIGKVATLEEVDFATNSKGNAFVVFLLKEYPDTYYCGGQTVTDKISRVVEQAGSLEDLNEELKADDVRLRFLRKKSEQRDQTGVYRHYGDFELVLDEEA